jgi:uncharacterized repeat protein (TIGR03803 family)
MIRFLCRVSKNPAASRFAAGKRMAVAAIFLALGVGSSGMTWAATLTPIYEFTGGDDGGYPQAGVVRDPAAEAAGIVPAGTLFGTTTSYGKLAGCGVLGGTLFMLTPPAASGVPWALTVLHAFDAETGSTFDGFVPRADLTADAAGNLYGTTALGGDSTGTLRTCYRGHGTVFELSPPAATGGKWVYRVLFRFSTGLGLEWFGKLALDPSSNGVLYGTSEYLGDLACADGGCGFVFSLTPPGVNGNTASGWAEDVLHVFRGGDDGSFPVGSLVFDKASPPALLGTAEGDGAFGDGIVFRLLPPNSPGNPASHWSEVVIHSFKGKTTDGAAPDGLIIDDSGLLYGATAVGGRGPGAGLGTVFEILPPSVSITGRWQEIVLHKFASAVHGDGALPSGLLRDAVSGNLYGTTAEGGLRECVGTTGCGTVYEIASTDNPRVWQESVLVNFDKSIFAYSNVAPPADLSFGADGNLYGTTYYGGLHGWGTVFQVTLP